LSLHISSFIHFFCHESVESTKSTELTRSTKSMKSTKSTELTRSTKSMKSTKSIDYSKSTKTTERSVFNNSTKIK